jgi:hypothetical protein
MPAVRGRGSLRDGRQRSDRRGHGSAAAADRSLDCSAGAHARGRAAVRCSPVAGSRSKAKALMFSSELGPPLQAARQGDQVCIAKPLAELNRLEND